MRPQGKGQHCVGCGERERHTPECAGAFADERPVVCRDCDAVLETPEAGEAHALVCRVPLGVVVGIRRPHEATRLYGEAMTAVRTPA